MTVAQAVHAIQSVGGQVRLKGDRIRCRIPDPAPEPVAEAVEVLRRHKPEALALLGPKWHPECLAAERKFRMPSAKLYPLLNHPVWTPTGKGTLLQVFSNHVTVHFKNEPRTCEFRPEDIAVSDDARQARETKPC
jgi:hypothetical protein